MAKNGEKPIMFIIFRISKTGNTTVTGKKVGKLFYDKSVKELIDQCRYEQNKYNGIEKNKKMSDNHVSFWNIKFSKYYVLGDNTTTDKNKYSTPLNGIG